MDGNWGATVKNRILITTLAILTMGFFVSASALAGEYPDPDPDVPAPTQQPTSVARLSVVQGQVSTAHGDAGEWANGTMNTPLVPGDRVSSGDRSRAEIQIDPYNVMRLDERTEARMADLQSNKIQLQLASGLMEYSVLNGTQADVEIDTPNMGVHPLSPGLYRIQVTSDTDTMLIVRHGEAEVLTNQGSQKVEAGQMIQIRGTDNPEYKVDAAPGRDDFDHWSSDRDRQLAAAPQPQPQPQYGQPQPQYGQPQPPPSQITGSGELNNYGQWGEVPDYGWCWTPQVDAGWVPYSAGNWGYEPYCGWTWISSEPWGWAPYHYGRWFNYGGAWRWWPGAGAFYGARPMWAPAYVSFFGWGHGFGAGFGFGSIGWLALGPRDIFHPWYGAGHSFAARGFGDFRGEGFVHPGGPAWGSNLERVGSDARIRGAMRNVSAQDFASGRMGRSMPVSESMLRSGSMMRGGLPISHTASFNGRASFSGSHFASGGSQHFFSSGGSAFAGRSSGFSSAGRTGMSAPSGRGESNWQSYSRGGASSGFQGRTAPGQNNWQRYASPNPYTRGGQSYNGGQRSYYGGGNAGRSGGSYYGGGSRAPLNLNQPIMRQRAPSGGYYGGGRSYSAPSGNYGGGRSYSAPSGNRGYSAPRSSGGGGGGTHSYGGGGGHSSGGGGGHSGGGGHGRR